MGNPVGSLECHSWSTYNYLYRCVGRRQATMKQKLPNRIDAELLTAARRYARSRGVSLASLVERSLREMARKDSPSFSSRWRGKFRAAERDDDPRYDALASKYLR